MAKSRRRKSTRKWCVKKGRKTVKCYASHAPARRHANRIGARCSAVKHSPRKHRRSR